MRDLESHDGCTTRMLYENRSLCRDCDWYPKTSYRRESCVMRLYGWSALMLVSHNG